MSSILVPHCEWCKKHVEQPALRVSREGYEVCASCNQKETRDDINEYEELCLVDGKNSGFCEACGIHAESLQDCSDPDIGSDASVYSACPSCCKVMNDKAFK